MRSRGHGVVNECHEVARPWRWRQTPDGSLVREEITLPERVARLYLDRREHWGLRPLDGLAAAPLLAEDGSLRTADGYDPSTRLWCERIPQVTVPEVPTRADAQAALLQLRAVLRTFPFADAARLDDPQLGVAVVDLSQPPGQDESAALMALLTAVCRPSLRLAPGLAVCAAEISGAGSGKGLLVRAICAIAYGQPPRALTKGGSRKELDKRLVAALIGAEPVLFLDNLNAVALKSDILASALTERPAYIRPLGQSVTVPLNPMAFVTVTGNGLSLSEDLARRFLLVELDAGMEDPEARPFRGDLVAEVLERRGELLQAVLTIWRWGRRNEPALSAGQPLGSFGPWGRWCRDPLLALGCADPVLRLSAAKADDPQRRAIAELFRVWWHVHGDTPVTAAGLADRVRAVVDPQNRGRQYLAWRLRRLEGTRLAGFVLLRHAPDGRWSADQYSLQPTAPAAGDGIAAIGSIGSIGGPISPAATPIPPDTFHPGPDHDGPVKAEDRGAAWEGEL